MPMRSMGVCGVLSITKNGSSRLRNYCGTGSLKACPSKTTRRAAQGMLKMMRSKAVVSNEAK